MDHKVIQTYYGDTLADASQLKTNACCTPDVIPDYIKNSLSRIHPEIRATYYGCGLVAPEALENMHILDLGCGTGQDCYLLAQWAGKNGRVTGIDMTAKQLDIAKQYLDWHATQFGYANVAFMHGYLEHMETLPLPEASFDIIVSNCVLNLTQNKPAVFDTIFKLLKPGGEFYFSDTYADRRMPQHLVNNPVLYAECLSGALYLGDFLPLAKKAGFPDPRLVSHRKIALDNTDIQKTCGDISFYSATWRLFKLDGLENGHENYGQSVVYRGTLAHHPDRLYLDTTYTLPTGKKIPVCGNTYRMLRHTRFQTHVDFFGNTDSHYGAFPNTPPSYACDTIPPAASSDCC